MRYYTNRNLPSCSFKVFCTAKQKHILLVNFTYHSQSKLILLAHLFNKRIKHTAKSDKHIKLTAKSDKHMHLLSRVYSIVLVKLTASLLKCEL